MKKLLLFFLFFMFIGFLHAGPPSKRVFGPLFQCRFDEGAGSETKDEVSGNYVTLGAGEAWVSGKFGRAVYGSGGANSCMYLPYDAANPVFSATGVTIFLHVHYPWASGTTYFINRMYTDGADGNPWQVWRFEYNTTLGLCWSYSVGSTAYNVYSLQYLPNRDCTIAVRHSYTATRKKVDFWIGTKKVYSATASGALRTDRTSSIRFGQYNNGGGNFCLHKIDDGSIYPVLEDGAVVAILQGMEKHNKGKR